MSTVIAAWAAVAAIIVFIVYKAVETIRKRIATFQFDGEIAVTLDELRPGSIGFVSFRGEYWKATSKVNIAPGYKVKIISREGLMLLVEPIEE